jgi:hypothetical protein
VIGRAALGEALERAAAFVAARGAPLDRLRLEAILGRRPAMEARVPLEALQRPDGAFAPLPGRTPAGAFEATADALEALFGIGVQGGAAVERAAEFLAAAQAADGSWGDAPGSPADRVAITARLAGALARTPYARPRTLAAAGDFLERHAPDAPREGGAPDELAALAHYFANAPDERADEVLQRCGRELERGFRTGTCDPVGVVRVLLACDAKALPGARLEADELATALLATQAPDGGWPAAGGGDVARIAATLDAALALVRLAA